MFRRRVWWFTYLAYFCLFGAFGGLCFALAMSPSGITAMSLVFLISVVFVACLTSAIVLQLKKERNRFERYAMIGGYLYPLLVVVWFLVVGLFS